MRAWPAALPGGLFLVLISCAERPEGPALDVWHGNRQKVGHLGIAQDDFNLMGAVFGPAPIASLSYSLNGAAPVRLTVGEGPFGFRRLAGPGHFNAEIPIANLRRGVNTVVLAATDAHGRETTETVTVERLEGSYPLPARIDWSKVTDPQEVGQYVDGRWLLTSTGLRTQHMGYDRIFLIGEKSWKDYQVTVEVTIHRVARETSENSGGNGLGVVLRFAGHVAGGPRNFPEAQPKWGYQPFGAIGWLRWQKGKPEAPPTKQFYRGDNDQRSGHGAFPVELERTYVMKLACRTLPDDPSAAGITRFSFKIWPREEPEPAKWDWEEIQTSEHALRQGAVALLAHHVDATFGDVAVAPL